MRVEFPPVVSVFAFLLFVLEASAEVALPQYNRDIRPILSEKCFACHGPDGAKREADLRLDQAESAHTVIDFADADSSAIIERITSDDPDLVMPPPHTGKTVSTEEVALLKSWIATGAEYQPHWAFVPPKRADLPQVSNKQWATNAIDEFALAKMEENGLSPAAAANRVTLIRRVTFDLTGLPPTQEEVSDFLADDSEEAYEKVVDRLLSSPRYGEHMARYWLDAARYGDTHGLHLDNYREIWPYRDWVIRSFNENMRWSDFIVKQLAGDLLPEPTTNDLIASGFNRCNVTTNEGGSISEEVYVRNVIDRVETTGTVFMGLTVGCAVCHDHKFDPISSQEFYSMFAIFNNLEMNPMDGNRKNHAPVISAPTPEQQQSLAEFEARKAKLTKAFTAPIEEVDHQQRDWEQAIVSGETRGVEAIESGNWYRVGPFLGDKNALDTRKQGPEGKPIDVAAKFKDSNGVELTWVEQPDWQDGKTIAGLTDQVAAVFAYRELKVEQEQPIQFQFGADDGIKVYLNGEQLLDDRKLRAVSPGEMKVMARLKPGTNRLLIKVMNYGGECGFHFAMVADAVPPADLLEFVKVEPAKRTPDQNSKLTDFYRTKVSSSPAVLNLLKEMASIDKERKQLEGQIPTTLISKERAQPKPAFVLKRGQYDAPDKELGPLNRSVPAVLPPLPEGAPANRLGFARWLVDPSHPLPARVAVNGFWQQCFGTGLVETSEDFGSQGTWPSHPELLDWLAVDFRESGWDVKRLMKQIVMSSTYRQSSKATAEKIATDPQNRLLSRGPRFRLDAEMLRDQALQVSGLLYNKIGGAPVKPPQPIGLWKAVGYSSSNTANFRADQGHEKVHRRSIYTFWKRTAPPPQMGTLDAPSRESCVMRRERTNTPLAALLLLNDPQYFEAARHLAQTTLQATGQSKPPQEIAAAMFANSTLRLPSEDELVPLLALYEASYQRYSSDPEAAAKVIAVGAMPIPDALEKPKFAAWTLVANALLNLDEVLNKE